MEHVWYASYDPGVPRSVEYPDRALPLILEETVGNHPGRIATDFFGARLTYERLWERIQGLSAALAQMGVRQGDRVAIMLPNCPQAVISYYAVLWMGAVVVLTNPMYVERELEHQWNDAEAEYAIVLDHLLPRVRNVLPRTGVRKLIVTSLAEFLPFPLKWLYPLKARKDKLFTSVLYSEDVVNFSRIIGKAPPFPPPCPVGVDDLALLQYTGGTTGKAKGVMLTHRNILANVAQMSAWLRGFQLEAESVLAVLPFFHVFGMTVCMNWPLYSAGTMVLLPRFEINQLLKAIHRARPTIFPGVPTLYVAIVNHPRAMKLDLSSIRFCVTGSAPMPVEILKRFEEITGSVIIEGYGLTEASPITHVNPLRGVRKPGSIGIPLPDTEYRIVDLETGVEEKGSGEEGELVVKGPQAMRGYWKMPEETERTLRDGWLFTGDIAQRDEAGYVYIVDRKKDMIIAGGFNVYPREIDEVLYTHPDIADAVAVGIPDPYRGETVKAFVVVKPGRKLTEQEVIDFCKSHLAAYKVPRQVELRDSLPKTAVGKILRKELRAETVGGER